MRPQPGGGIYPSRARFAEMHSDEHESGGCAEGGDDMTSFGAAFRRGPRFGTAICALDY